LNEKEKSNGRNMDKLTGNIIVRRNGAVLRQAREFDLPRIDEIAIICYAPIQASYLEIVGPEIYQGIRAHPELDWEVEKTNRIHRTFAEHPGCTWVLEDDRGVFAFLCLAVFPKRGRAWIEENGVLPERRGQGWAAFMLRHALKYLRAQGIRFVSLEVDLDDVHLPARRAYQAVGFDRHHHLAIYHQDLDENNPGSLLNTEDD